MYSRMFGMDTKPPSILPGPCLVVLPALGMYPGQPARKTLFTAIEAANALTKFPDDQELEARRRLCKAACQRAQIDGNGRQVLFDRVRVAYYKEFGSDFVADMKRFFNVADEVDLTDGGMFMELIKEFNIFEIALGKPRQGLFMFTIFFDEHEIETIHQEIKKKRESMAQPQRLCDC